MGGRECLRTVVSSCAYFSSSVRCTLLRQPFATWCAAAEEEVKNEQVYDRARRKGSSIEQVTAH
jgi:hypothetical protein